MAIQERAAASLAAELRGIAALTTAISRAQTVADIYDAALDALDQALGITRASILRFDEQGVMRFVAWRHLSDGYRAAVEGHTPWRPDSPDPEAFVVSDPAAEPSLAGVLGTIRAEGIASLGFVPLVIRGTVIGKFMLYFDVPTVLRPDQLALALVIAEQVAFAVERTRAEEAARASEERLRFALEAASMGTWEWDLTTNAVRWSDNIEALHGLPPGSFDGTFASYEREIHPDDKARVLAAARRAATEGLPYEVEYRIVAPDGTVRWVEGKGHVERGHAGPVRMSGICVDVSRRKQAELERLEAAHEASRQKDEFLAILSHELRTPLNAIMGWVQMLEAAALPASRVPEAIAIIARNARLQAQLVGDILDVSRIITGKLEIQRTPLEFAPIVQHAINAIRPAAMARSLTIDVALGDARPRVAGDAARLQQVLGNVLSNAVKFTPEHGRIDIRCSASEHRVELLVRDSGVGITPDFLPYVFDRFRQADSSSTRAHGGLGLGLSLARFFVERHGGTIHAESEGVNQGTTIRIVLPALSADQR